jgi:hypothetical protein
VNCIALGVTRGRSVGCSNLIEQSLRSQKVGPKRELSVALSTLNCSGCHVLHRSDGTAVVGAPGLAETSRTHRSKSRGVPATFLESANHVLSGAPPFFMGGESIASWLYQAYGAPWVKDDSNKRLKSITEAEYVALVTADRNAGAITRWNGSLYYPAKIPDLIGMKGRKYIDHAATHLHRGIGDLMRYAAQVAYVEMAISAHIVCLHPGRRGFSPGFRMKCYTRSPCTSTACSPRPIPIR